MGLPLPGLPKIQQEQTERTENMPREFLPPQHRRESRSNEQATPRAIERPIEDRMMRKAHHRAKRECAPFREDCWLSAFRQQD